MRTSFRGFAAVLTICIGLVGQAYAADISIRIDGIEGGAAHHAGEIEVESFSWGASQSGSPTGGGGGAGKAQFNDLSIVAETSKASPKLLEACATGKHIPTAILTCRKAGRDQQEYLVIKMEDVLISSYQTSGTGGDHNLAPAPPVGKKKGKKHPPEPVAPPTVPLESVSFNFSKITYSHRSGDELVEFSWNVDTNSSI